MAFDSAPTSFKPFDPSDFADGGPITRPDMEQYAENLHYLNTQVEAGLLGVWRQSRSDIFVEFDRRINQVDIAFADEGDEAHDFVSDGSIGLDGGTNPIVIFRGQHYCRLQNDGLLYTIPRRRADKVPSISEARVQSELWGVGNEPYLGFWEGFQSSGDRQVMTGAAANGARFTLGTATNTYKAQVWKAGILTEEQDNLAPDNWQEWHVLQVDISGERFIFRIDGVDVATFSTVADLPLDRLLRGYFYKRGSSDFFQDYYKFFATQNSLSDF